VVSEDVTVRRVAVSNVVQVGRGIVLTSVEVAYETVVV
jgi:hypothetical protein